jgi:hypothetical protein
MLTHHNNHSVLFNETELFLVYRTGNSLQLSHLYEWIWAGSVILTEIIHQRELRYVLRGHLNRKAVIAKIATEGSEYHLRAEYAAYSALR